MIKVQKCRIPFFSGSLAESQLFLGQKMCLSVLYSLHVWLTKLIRDTKIKEQKWCSAMNLPLTVDQLATYPVFIIL